MISIKNIMSDIKADIRGGYANILNTHPTLVWFEPIDFPSKMVPCRFSLKVAQSSFTNIFSGK
jgi:hypothetical protein